MNYSREEKAKWLEDWKRSGKKAWTYAKENGLVPQTFVGWTKKKAKSKHSFIEIRPQAFQQASMILVEKGDAKIHIPLCLSQNELRSVMEALGVAL